MASLFVETAYIFMRLFEAPCLRLVIEVVFFPQKKQVDRGRFYLREDTDDDNFVFVIFFVSNRVTTRSTK